MATHKEDRSPEEFQLAIPLRIRGGGGLRRAGWSASYMPKNICNRRQSPVIEYIAETLSDLSKSCSGPSIGLRTYGNSNGPAQGGRKWWRYLGRPQQQKKSCSGVNLHGKRILVTGVSAGLGVETARSLAAHGAPELWVRRGDLTKAEAATTQVRQDAAAHGGSFELVELDLAEASKVCARALTDFWHSVNLSTWSSPMPA